MCVFKVLKANRVDLWHTSFLGLSKSAKPKSAVCPAQKWPIRVQNGKIQNSRHWRTKMNIYVNYLFSKHGRNLNEMCFCGLSYMGFLNKVQRSCLKLIFDAKKSGEFIAKIKQYRQFAWVCRVYPFSVWLAQKHSLQCLNKLGTRWYNI